jgi:hypothetical protein
MIEASRIAARTLLLFFALCMLSASLVLGGTDHIGGLVVDESSAALAGMRLTITTTTGNLAFGLTPKADSQPIFKGS